MPLARTPEDSRAIAWWLILCAVMVFAMVMLGGATRLTESGLSMVEWQPLTLLPPIGDAQWQAEFHNYQQFPEFLKKNSWMTVDDFKNIYWLEYTHRLWGRLIGAVFLLPFLWFASRRIVDRTLSWKLAGLFVLGGLQGGLGWFMVSSGLESRPDVSQYRLAAHLITALILYACLIWVALDLFREARAPEPRASDTGLSRLSLTLPVAVLFVAMAGAFVAGLDAGQVYNTFPLMDGRLVPEGLFAQVPWYSNFFENVTTVQFDHRVVAIALVVFVSASWVRARRGALSRRARALMNLLGAMVFIQAALGITTLLLVVPVPVALAHQTGAVILFTLAVAFAHETRVPRALAVNAAAHLKPAE